VTDRIDIEGLDCRAILGIFPWERKRRQPVVLDLALFTDTRRAGRTDRIRDALDYKAVSKRVQAHVAASRCFLVERLAAEVAALLLREFRPERVIVRVSKPGALRGARDVAVTIERARR
jgi:dihydroneopterin aldolase